MLMPTTAISRRFLTRKGTRFFVRGLSSRVPIPDTDKQPPQQQPFVKTRLEPGEWDPERKNPLYRPKFRSSARIIAADDFANRPTVGLNSDFESLQDGMVTLSWLDQNEQKLIYQLYLDLMVSAESSSGGKTSHEYVMRVIAQKFNLTAERVAAVVQLQHNEQQMILENPDIELCDDLADEMDRIIKQEISDAYQTFNLKKPESFVEDPVNEVKDGKKWTIVNDVFDVDQMAEDAIVREEREARLIIDGHVYIEDVDEESVMVPMDKDCRYLLKQKEVIQKQLSEQESRVHAERKKKTAREPEWRTKNGEGETRERYKYVAQTVNTRQLKKARAKHRSYINNNPENTLVEHNGSLRPANMLDMKALPWKATRNNMEHIYEDARKGWLDRVNRNMTKSWGRAPARAPRLKPPPPPPPPPAASEFGALPITEDIPLGVSSKVAEMKASEEVTSDLSASKVAELEVAPPVSETVLEASNTPAVESSSDSNIPTSDSELIADMNAAEVLLEVPPPSMEGDPDVSALVEEPIVAADVSAETVDVVPAPVEEPVVAANMSAETVDVVAAPAEDPVVAADVSVETVEVVAAPAEEPVVAADVSAETVDAVPAPVEEPTVAMDASEVVVAASQSDFIASEKELKSEVVETAEELTLSASPSSELPNDFSSTTDTAAVEEMNTAGDSQVSHKTASPPSSNAVIGETNASDIAHKSIDDTSPTSDNSLIEEMNASEASLIAASLDHQIDSSGEDQTPFSSSSTTTDNALVNEMSTEAALSSASSEESVLEVASVGPTAESNVAGLGAEASSGKDPTAEDGKSVESEVVYATDVAVESTNIEGRNSVADESIPVEMSGGTGHPVASSIDPHTTVEDVIVEDVSNTEAISSEAPGHSEEDNSKLNDGDPQKAQEPQDKQ